MGISDKVIVQLQKDKLEAQRLKDKGFSDKDIAELLVITEKSYELLKRIPIIC